jgi:hypothetical protein
MDVKVCSLALPALADLGVNAWQPAKPCDYAFMLTRLTAQGEVSRKSQLFIHS